MSQEAFREVLQCAIYSAERQQMCFGQLAVVTTLLALNSTESWQHTQTYICKLLTVNTNLNKGFQHHTLIYLHSQTQKHGKCSGWGLYGNTLKPVMLFGFFLD